MNESLNLSTPQYAEAINVRSDLLGDVIIIEKALSGMIGRILNLQDGIEPTERDGDFQSMHMTVAARIKRAHEAAGRMASAGNTRDIRSLGWHANWMCDHLTTLGRRYERGDWESAYTDLKRAKARLADCESAITRWLDVKCVGCNDLLKRGDSHIGGGIQGTDVDGGVYCQNCVDGGRVEQYNATVAGAHKKVA